MRVAQGWSLIEVLIAITIAAVAGGLIINLLVSSNKIFFDQSAQISHGLSLNQIELELTKLVKSSVSIAAQYPLQGSPIYTSDSNTLVVKLPAINESGAVIETVYDYGVIEPDAQLPAVLRLRVFKDAASFRKQENKVLSTNLSNLSFSYIDGGNNPVSPSEAERIKFVINLSTKSGFSDNESSGSGTLNIKNL